MKFTRRITLLSIVAFIFTTIATNLSPVITACAREPGDFTVVMVGDILLHDGIEKCALREDGSYDYTEVFRHTKDEIEAADLAIVNEEVIIGGEELRVSGYPSFNAPYEIADELAETGFDVICHATNHALDRGKKGIVNCLSYWKDNYPQIMPVGIYESAQESDELCIYEKDGYKIAVLNYTYGTNGIQLPKDMPYAVNLIKEDKVIRDLAKAEKEADYQKEWAKIFADGGADVIIGTHPHVIEPLEIVTADDGRKVPVYYSLGNFVNWTSGQGRGVANRMVGAMAVITLNMDEAGDVYVKDYGVKPLVCHVESATDGATVYFLDDYTQAKSFLNEIRKRDDNFSYLYCEDLCYSIYDEDYRR